MTTREAANEALAVIARAAQHEVMVFGDLPPAAHDLDLLVVDDDLGPVSCAMRAEGFIGHGHDWVLFRGGEATVVDLFAASTWQLPAEELAAVFAAAEQVEGLPTGVVRPAAHHRVLLLARRLHWGGAIDDRRQRRLEEALASGANVAERAREHAPAWGLVLPLEALLRGVKEPAVQPAPRRRRPWVRSPRPVLVTLSGVDGSGKSTLAQGLERLLEELELPVAVAWARLEWSTLHENPMLDRLAAPVKAVLRLLVGGRDEPTVAAPPAATSVDEGAWARAGSQSAGSGSDVARRLRQQSPLVTTVWTAIVAILQAQAQRRAVATTAGGGAAIVVCDRSTLDSVVHLRRLYSAERRLPVATWLLTTLSPRPDVAIFLEVDPTIALARKRDVFGVDELMQHAALYVEECGRVGTRRVDASRPPADLLDEIAKETWLAAVTRPSR